MYLTSKSAEIDSNPISIEFFPDKQFSETEAKTKAISLLPSLNDLLNPYIDLILDKFINEIAPHYEYELRRIKSSGPPQMKQAFEFVKRDMWSEAKNIWENLLKDLTLSKIYPFIYNNLGIYYEIKGDLNKAEEQFSHAYQLTNNNTYLDAKVRIKKRIVEQQKLKKQIETR